MSTYHTTPENPASRRGYSSIGQSPPETPGRNADAISSAIHESPVVQQAADGAAFASVQKPIDTPIERDTDCAVLGRNEFHLKFDGPISASAFTNSINQTEAADAVSLDQPIGGPNPDSYTPDPISDDSLHNPDLLQDLRALVVPGQSSSATTTIMQAIDLEGFELLRLWAEQFADAQQARISASNRFTAATKLGAPLDPTTVETITKQTELVENAMALPMKRTFKKIAPDIYKWVQDTPGLGEHTVARLLGCIGHPAIAIPHHWEGEGTERKLIADEPYLRSVSQLWSYCGVGDPTRKRRKGMTKEEATQMGNPVAKKLVWLIANNCMKQTGAGNKRRSPYRDIYELARAKYEERDWSDLHKHNAALRYVGKQFLKDVWVVANQSS